MSRRKIIDHELHADEGPENYHHTLCSLFGGTTEFSGRSTVPVVCHHPPHTASTHSSCMSSSFRSIPCVFRLVTITTKAFAAATCRRATADGIAHCNASMGLCPHMQLDCAFQMHWFFYTAKLNRSSDRTWPKAELKAQSHLAGAFFHLLAPLYWLSSSLLEHWKA
jgi:hypothetical protein